MQNEINGVKEALAESNVQLAEYAKTMREIEWGHFDYLQDRISQLTQEADFLIELMSNSDLYDERGQLSDIGTATMGLHAQNYNTYMAQADQYAKEIRDLDKEIANNPYNTDLIERREELLGLQQDSILAAEQEKQSIIDLVRDGIDLELESLKELIDAYTKSLDQAKDLYDYQKKVKDQTSEIASLQKQLSAYENDLSEETRATVQKLKVELENAQEDLQQTEYERYISEQKKLLDDLYDEYEDILNQRLDNVEALIGDMINVVNEKSDSISQTLIETANNVGYTLTESIQKIWDGSLGAIDGTISKYGDDFSNKLTSLNSVLDSIASNVASMAGVDENGTGENANGTTSNGGTGSNAQAPSTPSTNQNGSQNATASVMSDKDYYGVALAIINGGYGWGGGQTRKNNLQAKGFDTNKMQSIINQLVKDGYVNTGAWAGKYYGIRDLSPYHFNRYLHGGIIDYTGLAIVDGAPNKPESIFNAEDTRNLISLRDVLRARSQQALSLMNVPYNVVPPQVTGISDISSRLSKLDGHIINGDTTITFGDILIDHVEDYNDFVTQLRDDPKFEKMVKAMTTDRLAGKSALAKYNYQWK